MRWEEYILSTVFKTKSQGRQKTGCLKYKLFIDDIERKRVSESLLRAPTLWRKVILSIEQILP